MAQIHMFPKEVLEFQQECHHKHHIGLWTQLENQFGEEWTKCNDEFKKLVMMATFMGIILDGTYTYVQLAEMINKHMKDQRARESTLHVSGTLDH